jgi:AefR-like transcriptional repressor, C-terminal domain
VQGRALNAVGAVLLPVSERKRAAIARAALHTREIATLLAAPLAQLTAAGRLSAPDPRQAAEHLSALTVGQVGARSLMGTVPLTEDETARLLSSGVQVFLRAYQAARLRPRRRRLSLM